MKIKNGLPLGRIAFRREERLLGADWSSILQYAMTDAMTLLCAGTFSCPPNPLACSCLDPHRLCSRFRPQPRASRKTPRPRSLLHRRPRPGPGWGCDAVPAGPAVQAVQVPMLKPDIASAAGARGGARGVLLLWWWAGGGRRGGRAGGRREAMVGRRRRNATQRAWAGGEIGVDVQCGTRARR